MNKFTNPLDNIKVASPCPADWNEMYGNERKRFCSECKLNVYNLSEMTQSEAENFVINAEGRICVKFLQTRRRNGFDKRLSGRLASLQKKVFRVRQKHLPQFVQEFWAEFSLSINFKPIQKLK